MSASVSPDRVALSSLRSWSLTLLVGVQMWAALTSLSEGGRGRGFAAEAAALVAVLAVFGLRSVPIRHVVRGMTVLSGLLLARFGELGALGGIAGSWRVLVWVGATASVLVLAPSSRSVPGATGMVVDAKELERTPAGAVPGTGTDTGGRRASVPMAVAVSAVALLAGLSLLVGPRASTWFPVGSKAGDLVDLGDAREDNVLVASDSLDMTKRPRLTERVVLSVRSPLASFWRSEVFDTWDGVRWTRSGGNGGEFLDEGRVEAAPDDLAAEVGEPSTQEFRVEVGFATAVPVAPSAVRIDSERELAQRSDGSIVSPVEPLSRGTTYSVQSRQVPTDPAALRASGDEPVPDAVLEQYAQPPVATERTVALARSITAGIDNDYDKVRAIEEWMDTNTRYSLDAPLAPQGVDVVDHFLFESQLGWCEQIASSLVVLSRLAGVPARLAVGFAPGEWDEVGGRFVVRERDAHAWAEVWFPEVGWVTFDPTAQVPLAGTAEATPGAAAIDWREVAGASLVLVAVVALVLGPARRAWRRRRGTRTERRTRRELQRRWDVEAERQLEERGRQAGRERLAGETLASYAAVLAPLLEDPSVLQLAERIDHERYGGGTGSPGAADTPGSADSHDPVRVGSST